VKQDIIYQLKELFRKCDDRYDIHAKAKVIIESAAQKEEFLFDIIRDNLLDNNFLNKLRHYPTLSMSICEIPEFSFVMNIFPPLPSRKTNISFQSIHHHGQLLLTTVGAFGPGYKSILFKKDFKINSQTEIADLKIEKIYQNEFGRAEFVDAFQPHVVFYPASFSATYAFWCDNKRSAKGALKKLPLLNKIKQPLLKLLKALKAESILGMNKIEYFDFYIDNGKVKALKNRLDYEKVGTNRNFLQNIFCFIQQTGFQDESFLRALLNNPNEKEDVRYYIDLLLKGISIEDSFFEGHLEIPKVNILEADIITACG
jgi:hypothetical protein